MIVCLACISSGLYAQNSPFLQTYRTQVKAYNQDIKAADYAVAIHQEKEHSAKADFLPVMAGSANAQYTGNPATLSVNIPDIDTPLNIQGSHTRYGTTLTLTQTVYSGGALKAGYDKARKENEMAHYEKARITHDILYEADVHYWNKVAREEMMNVAENYRNSVAELVKVISHRVEEEYADRNDLLLAEVKLNDAEYRLLQACHDAETARMSMNSFSGTPLGIQIQTDSVVLPVTEIPTYNCIQETAMTSRPEIQIAAQKVDIQKQTARIANAYFLPKLSVGADGGYTSPGYDFAPDLSPNYAVYAKLSIPIFEWGKRKNTRRTGTYSINMAIENQKKVTDCIRLEAETAFYTYSQAVRQVRLTENSLKKAAESERIAMDRYKEGSISIVEVIDAQLYHQEAQINYIQSKLNAQIARSGLDRAIGKTETTL